MEERPPGRRHVAVLALGATVLGVWLAGALSLSSVRDRPGALQPPHVIWQRSDPAVEAIIRIECRRYGVPEDFALCVADHESRFDPQAVGDHGDAVGLYQFHLSTWQHFRTMMELPVDDLRLDAREAARTACWAFVNGFEKRWTVVRLGPCTPFVVP